MTNEIAVDSQKGAHAHPIEYLLDLVAMSLRLPDWRADPVRVCTELLTDWPDLCTVDMKWNKRRREELLKLLRIEQMTEAEAVVVEWCKGPERIRLPGRHERSMVCVPYGDLAAVTLVLLRGQGQYDFLLARFLLAQWFVGLTLREWINSHLDAGKIMYAEGGKPALLLIGFHEIDPAGRIVVEEVLTELACHRSSGHKLPALFEAIRKRLYRIQHEMNVPRGKRITLTSSHRSKSRLKIFEQREEFRKSITKEKLDRALAALGESDDE